MDALERLLAAYRARVTTGGSYTPPVQSAEPPPVEPPPPLEQPRLFETAALAGPSARQRLEADGLRVSYITTDAGAQEAVAELLTASPPLGLDIETARLTRFRSHPQAGLQPHLSQIRLVQLFGGGQPVYLFDLFRLGSLEALAPVWGLPLVAHNALFELKHLIHAGVSLEQPLECTMLQHNVLAGGLSSLAELAQEHLGWPLDKEQQTSDWAAPDLSVEQLAYAALDAVVAYHLHRKLQPLLEARRGTRVYQLMREAQPAIARLELAGCHFDVAAHARLLERYEQQQTTAAARLAEQLGPGVSPSSGKQLSAWFEANLPAEALATWPRTAGGLLETTAEALGNCPHPAVAALLEWKLATKRITTYGTGYTDHISPATGRIHASFRLGGTDTGRLACHRPNIQNPPRDPAFRALFSAPPGRVLVVADYGQIELRVAALLARDPAMLEAYQQGRDLHTQTAAAVARVPVEAVTKQQRQLAKAVNFGLLFGQGAKGLARYAAASYGVELTEEEAKKARHLFFMTYPGLSRWQRETVNAAKRTWQARTPAGRLRDFPQDQPAPYTEALNTPVQGGAAEIMLAALAHLERSLRGLDAHLVNIVHDELVVEAAEQEAAAVQQALEQAMVAGMLAIFPTASTRGLVEAHAGPNWAAAKG
jgi:DNA polymerase-1